MKEPLGWMLVALTLTVVAKVAADRPHPTDARFGAATMADPSSRKAAGKSTELDDLCVPSHAEQSEISTVIAADRKSNRLRVYRPSGELLQEIRIARPSDTDRPDIGPAASEDAELVVVNQRTGKESDCVYRVTPASGELVRVD